MLQINVHDAKTRFSKVLARVEAGEEVLIAKNGRPVARLVPIGGKPSSKRPFGTAKGRLRLSADWDAPLPDALIKAFES